MLIFKCDPYLQFSYIGDIYIILFAQYTFCNLHILFIVDIVDDTFDTTEKEIDRTLKKGESELTTHLCQKETGQPKNCGECSK